MYGKVSFIVPVYNAGPYLATCIYSILDLDYKDTEIIIIDDGSSDNSCEIGKSFENIDTRVKHLIQSNKGASAARNRGLEVATGDWIVFVDADDWIEPDLCRLLEYGHCADIIYFGFREYRDGDIIKKSIGLSSFVDSSGIDLLLSRLFTSKELFFGYTWNKFYRKSIIEQHKLRFNESLFIKEDEEFIIRYCRYIASIYISDEVPYNYRVLQSSISHKKLKFKNMAGLAACIDEDFTDYPWVSFKQDVVNQSYHYFLYGIGELRKSPLQSEAINAFIRFVDRSRHFLKPDLPYLWIFGLKSCCLKKKLIKVMPFNPVVIRLKPSYFKFQFCRIGNLVKRAL